MKRRLINNKIMRDIKILGIGSSKYRMLLNNLTEVVKELNIEVEVEKFEEIEDFIHFSIVKIPTLMINNEVVIEGYAPTAEELKRVFFQKFTKFING
ncbi:MAG: galactitol-specific phosphotransferase system IIB component [Saprospiraceae bacterium]|jgi:galactitol-specific phosphotransferase system IIB component